MPESTVEQGKKFIMQVFHRIRAEYKDRLIIERVFPWRRGDTFEDSHEEPSVDEWSTYYLLFRANEKCFHLTFTRDEFGDVTTDTMVRGNRSPSITILKTMCCAFNFR